ncbi:MAG: FtsQ-type POTRA domain-containing protein [Snowella sp.]|nr:FtsQ-type POTRA domain-containing protein [Snowella sp.]
MTNSIVSDSLKTRRQTLRSQRRLKGWQSVWRFSVLCGLTGGLVWLMSRPEWAIRDQSQIHLSGNKLLSSTQLYQFVPITYPQSIWQLSTQQLGKKMETIPPLARVEVTRQLFPAHISIAVQERQPIAVATSDQGKGFLDKEGTFIAQSFYKSVPSGASLPKSPQFLGFSEQYKNFWQQNYSLINGSTVKITTIDGRNPSNLMLLTEIGQVHLGSDITQLPQQLKVLGQMKKLPSRVPSSRIAYIDLSNPAYPSIRLRAYPKSQ